MKTRIYMPYDLLNMKNKISNFNYTQTKQILIESIFSYDIIKKTYKCIEVTALVIYVCVFIV